MRLALVRLVLAATAMIAVAFVLPLGLLAKQIAYDRALSDARNQAAVAAAALAAADGSVTSVDRALATADLTDTTVVWYPGSAPSLARAEPDDVALAVERTRSLITEVGDGVVLLHPVVADTGTTVVEVHVPEAHLWRGVWPAWLAMGVLALGLVAGSVALADRLGARLVAAARHLGRAAKRFGAHDFVGRVEPGGPPELVEAGVAFNAMATRIVDLMDAERERSADLSHRLRTPLTALRLDADALPSGEVSDRIRDSLHVLENEIDALITTARRPVAHAEPEVVDLVEVLAARLAFWTVLAEHEDREWRVVGDDEPIWLSVPREDLAAAVDALISNVFRHTQPRTPFRVTIRPDALSVEDGGPGIADVGSAMDRGVSGADSTGLGLDIVQAVAARAGGEIVVDNGELGGARITLTFVPATPLEAVPAE
jgi:signal transduction histidine kinase